MSEQKSRSGQEFSIKKGEPEPKNIVPIIDSTISEILPLVKKNTSESSANHPPQTTIDTGKKSQEIKIGTIEKNGKYRFVKKLGEGGMGEVWLVDEMDKCYEEQGTTVCAQSVVKVIKPTLLNSEKQKKDFKREMDAMVDVENEFIGRVFDTYEEHGDMRIVMEYLSGGDAFTLIGEMRNNKQDYPPQRREQLSAAIGYQVALALEYMATRHVLHRDLKAPNVLIQNGVFEQFPLAKVIDFGLVKYLNGPNAEGKNLRSSTEFLPISPDDTIDDTTQHETEPGQIKGTPYSMPPETIKGEKATYQTDSYALGLLMYQLAAANETPFDKSGADFFLLKQKTENAFKPLHEQLGYASPTTFTQIVETLMDGNLLERELLIINTEGERIRLSKITNAKEYDDKNIIFLQNPTEIKKAIRNAIIEEYPELAQEDPFAITELPKRER